VHWFELEWDEEPDVDGEYGPYFQSQWLDLYQQYIEILKSNGFSYEKEGGLYLKVSYYSQVTQNLIRCNVIWEEEKDFVIIGSNSKTVFHLVNVINDISI
jgi:glutamyl/glutaminyl-tRNA synthetase